MSSKGVVTAAVPERFLRAMLDSIDEAVLATDHAGRVTFMNAAAERLVGCRCADALGEHIDGIFQLRDTSGAPVSSSIHRALEERTAAGRAHRVLVRKSGGSVDVDEAAFPLRDDDGRAHGAALLLRDASERRKLEQRLAQSERLASIGTMAAGMAHEINNPLAYVITNIGLAVEGLLDIAKGPKRGGGSPGQLHDLVEALREANEGADRVRRIVQDLKKFARVDDASLAVIDLPEVLDAAVKITANAVRHHARLRKEYGDT
ncbi:MAG TPA: PAS domain S-box protein, partial [Polyangiaceae bacterium]|nr:PAS domain S-box protein [Polyangiaceae bacterium]